MGSEPWNSGVLEYLTQCVTGPNLVATALLAFIAVYWLLVIVGGLGMDALDLDLDLDLDGSPDSVLGFGLTPVRFLNIGRVPMALWLSLFALSFWLISMILWFIRDHDLYEGQWAYATLWTVRNAALACLATKGLTEPLKRYFVANEDYSAEELVGKSCRISTQEATSEYGQARFTTDAAPLILEVRTAGGRIPKGEEVQIVDYDAEKRVYLIEKPKEV